MTAGQPQPACLAWDDIEEGRVAAWDFSVSSEDMDDFARISGDYNPLHIRDDFAQAKGFKSRVVYGALLAAQLSRLVGMELPGRDAVFVGQNISFRNPVYVGDVVYVEAKVTQVSDSTRAVVMKVKMRVDGKVVVSGTVEALLRDG